MSFLRKRRGRRRRRKEQEEEEEEEEEQEQEEEKEEEEQEQEQEHVYPCLYLVAVILLDLKSCFVEAAESSLGYGMDSYRFIIQVWAIRLFLLFIIFIMF